MSVGCPVCRENEFSKGPPPDAKVARKEDEAASRAALLSALSRLSPNAHAFAVAKEGEGDVHKVVAAMTAWGQIRGEKLARLRLKEAVRKVLLRVFVCPEVTEFTLLWGAAKFGNRPGGDTCAHAQLREEMKL